MSASSKCVIREVAKDVWIFSCPFARFGIIPFGGRSTAVKLQSGDVWVLASTPLDQETKTKLDEIGPVKWVVGADAVHHLYLAEFKKEYPDAKLIAVDDVKKRKQQEGLEFHGAWGEDPSDRRYGFEDDIQHCFFSGHGNKDVAFFHPASKTMMEADLLFNLPATEQYSKAGWSGKFPLFSTLKPDSWLHRRFAWMLGVDKEAMKRDVKTVAGWDFDRIIPCHGDVIETGGKEAWKAAYQWYFE